MGIEKEIKKVEAEINNLQFRLAVKQEVLTHLMALNSPEQTSSAGNTLSTMRRSLRRSLFSQLQTVLMESGQPMTVDEMIEAVKQKGVSTTAKTGLKPLVASLISRRKNVFVRIGRGLYDLKDKR
jgi:hypothetical protein